MSGIASLSPAATDECVIDTSSQYAQIVKYDVFLLIRFRRDSQLEVGHHSKPLRGRRDVRMAWKELAAYLLLGFMPSMISSKLPGERMAFDEGGEMVDELCICVSWDAVESARNASRFAGM